MTDPPPAVACWATATAFLSEAEQSSVLPLPRAATHAAYYAMFHAARAVLLVIEGPTAPNKHTSVVSRFGHQAHVAGDAALNAAADLLREVKKHRLIVDYDTRSNPDPAAAMACVRNARVFLQACATWQNFPQP